MGGDPGLLATPQGRKWYDEINSGKGAEAALDITDYVASQKIEPRPSWSIKGKSALPW
jgi:hypothetical protein